MEGGINFIIKNLSWCQVHGSHGLFWIIEISYKKYLWFCLDNFNMLSWVWKYQCNLKSKCITIPSLAANYLFHVNSHLSLVYWCHSSNMWLCTNLYVSVAFPVLLPFDKEMSHHNWNVVYRWSQFLSLLNIVFQSVSCTNTEWTKKVMQNFNSGVASHKLFKMPAQWCIPGCGNRVWVFNFHQTTDWDENGV